MLSQPQPLYVILLIFIGVILIIAGIALFLLPLFGAHSYLVAMILLLVGIFVILLAGCSGRS